MKYFYLTCLILFIYLKCSALNIINISAFPNISVPGTNYLILFSQPGVTNYEMNVLQFETWLAGDSVFITALKNNPAINVSGVSTNFFFSTNSPNYIATNCVAFWATNQSFTSLSPYNFSPVFQAELVISNTANAKITNTLPWTAYSVSLGGPVSQAVVAINSVLHLKVNYFNGMYYIEDYGKNNSTLWDIATNINDSGFLVITNGHVSIRH